MPNCLPESWEKAKGDSSQGAVGKVLVSSDILYGEVFIYLDASCIIPVYFVAEQRALVHFIYLYRDIAIWTAEYSFIQLVAAGQTLFLWTFFLGLNHRFYRVVNERCIQ